MEQINTFKAAFAAVCAALTALWGWLGWLVVAWIACMALDYLTGSAAAMQAGNWSSQAARNGLWHKLGGIVAVLISGILAGQGQTPVRMQFTDEESGKGQHVFSVCLHCWICVMLRTGSR